MQDEAARPDGNADIRIGEIDGVQGILIRGILADPAGRLRRRRRRGAGDAEPNDGYENGDCDGEYCVSGHLGHPNTLSRYQSYYSRIRIGNQTHSRLSSPLHPNLIIFRDQMEKKLFAY